MGIPLRHARGNAGYLEADRRPRAEWNPGSISSFLVRARVGRVHHGKALSTSQVARRMNVKTTILLSVLWSAALTTFATDIRVRNASDVDFQNVIVGGRNYGDIKRGAVTDYQTWPGAYRYAYVSLRANGKPMGIQPIDYVGERLLGEGRFTYVLTTLNDRLDIRAEMDDSIASLIIDLSSPSQKTRDTAASGLRAGYTPPARSKWESLVDSI